jgi:predicted transcriptional regulator
MGDSKDSSRDHKEILLLLLCGKDKAIAYKLKDVVVYDTPKDLSDYGISQAPQSFVYLD